MTVHSTLSHKRWSSLPFFCIPPTDLPRMLTYVLILRPRASVLLVKASICFLVVAEYPHPTLFLLPQPGFVSPLRPAMNPDNLVCFREYLSSQYVFECWGAVGKEMAWKTFLVFRLGDKGKYRTLLWALRRKLFKQLIVSLFSVKILF